MTIYHYKLAKAYFMMDIFHEDAYLCYYFDGKAIFISMDNS